MESKNSAQDRAIFEIDGRRYLLVGIGPAETGMSVDIAPSPAPAPAVRGIETTSTGEPDANSVPAPGKKKFVYGLKGIAELFGCSKSTAYNIKRSGRINAAISQIGNTIVVDAEKALALARTNK